MTRVRPPENAIRQRVKKCVRRFRRDIGQKFETPPDQARNTLLNIEILNLNLALQQGVNDTSAPTIRIPGRHAPDMESFAIIITRFRNGDLNLTPRHQKPTGKTRSHRSLKARFARMRIPSGSGAPESRTPLLKVYFRLMPSRVSSPSKR